MLGLLFVSPQAYYTELDTFLLPCSWRMPGCLVIIGSALLYLQMTFGYHNLVSRYSMTGRRSLPIHAVRTTRDQDIDSTFTALDRLLFQRFAWSVATEMNASRAAPSYNELIDSINQLAESRPASQVNDAGKNMLTRLFPAWLLKQYQWMFARPFPRFSAWMNAWVTKWTTQWLMGSSAVIDLPLPDGSLAKQQGLKIEKCRFLETSGCLQTCIHACKIPTQRFFLEEMGLPVTLSPNVSDYSCTFEFGVLPVPLQEDPISNSPCLQICPKGKRSTECGI